MVYKNQPRIKPLILFDNVIVYRYLPLKKIWFVRLIPPCLKKSM